MERYQVLDEVGTGRSSCVRKARDLETGNFVAMKRMDTQERSVCGCRKEAEMQRRVHDHPSIATVHGTIETPVEFVIVQEFAGNGDCATAFLENRLPHPLALFAEVVDAIEHIHSRNLAHLDVKLENILLNKDGSVLLTDFGHATSTLGDTSPLLDCACCEQVVEYEQGGYMKPIKGTRAYLPPEVLSCRGPEQFRQLDYPAVDVWALGVLLHVLTVGAFPWDEARDDPAYPEYQEYLITGEVAGWSELPIEIVQLLRAMLCPDPRYRFTIRNVKTFMAQKWRHFPEVVAHLSKHTNNKHSSSHLGANDARHHGVESRSTQFSQQDQHGPGTVQQLTTKGMIRAQSLARYIVIVAVAGILLMFGQRCAPALPGILSAILTRAWKRLLPR